MSEAVISYQQSFFITPFRISNLPGLTMAYFRIYQLIFQFWNNGKQCFISNRLIKERTGIGSESTVREALSFFEKAKELVRVVKNGKRYLIQPNVEIEDKTKKESKEPVGDSTPPRRQIDAPPAAKSTHNINNINNNKLIKDKKEKSIFCSERKTLKPAVLIRPVIDKKNSYQSFPVYHPSLKDYEKPTEYRQSKVSPLLDEWRALKNENHKISHLSDKDFHKNRLSNNILQV